MTARPSSGLRAIYTHGETTPAKWQYCDVLLDFTPHLAMWKFPLVSLMMLASLAYRAQIV